MVNPGDGNLGIEAQNRVTKAVYESVNEEGRVFVTSTVIDGIYAIRVVGASPRVRRETLERAFEIVVEKVVRVRSAGGEGVDVKEVGEVQVRGV